MLVFGGTDGVQKVNDFHVLDLDELVWSTPTVKGTPPRARESHSATLVGSDKLVVFGGSAEGEGNYLNDIHILDVSTMTWHSPIVQGEGPSRRDSHAASSVGHRLVVLGGDCGEQYLGKQHVYIYTHKHIDTYTHVYVIYIAFRMNSGLHIDWT